ncbi:hypothetical protein F4802DRAFT_568289 [Xylaria palmicola]|nr:hypothetical protein F4802DRAFT_568289 [Xylaria palmicola]
MHVRVDRLVGFGIGSVLFTGFTTIDFRFPRWLDLVRYRAGHLTLAFSALFTRFWGSAGDKIANTSVIIIPFVLRVIVIEFC